MKNLAITIVLITALIACDRKKENTQNHALTVYQEAMKIHNEVMPHMDEMYTLEGKLKSLRDSLLTDSISNVQKLTVVIERLTALETASKDMMDWMHNIQDVPREKTASGQKHHMEHPDQAAMKETKPEDILRIQQEQKAKIEAAKQAMESSIQGAEKLLKNKSE